MVRAAIIKNGRVANIIIVNSLEDYPGAIDATDGKIGDVWDGTQFSPYIPTPEEQAEIDAAAAARQAAIAAKEQLALDQVAKLSYTGIETYVNANVTNLAEAKVFLIKLAKVVKALVDQQT